MLLRAKIFSWNRFCQWDCVLHQSEDEKSDVLLMVFGRIECVFVPTESQISIRIVLVLLCQTPKSFTSTGFDPLRTLLYNFEWNCSNRNIYLIIICGNLFVRMWIISDGCHSSQYSKRQNAVPFIWRPFSPWNQRNHSFLVLLSCCRVFFCCLFRSLKPSQTHLQ